MVQTTDAVILHERFDFLSFDRALFLQAVLKKDHAKPDDMVAIYSWSDTRQGLTQVVSYV